MSEGPEESDDLLEGIYQGAIQPALQPKSRTSFKPWHKPRKHFLRVYQWCHETRQLLKLLKVAEGGELRYLGLPGEDLLDVRVLKGVCESAKVVLRYLGFDSSLASTQLNLSRHEVNSDKFIHSSSVVIADRLEELASRETIAYQYVARHAPFDVINLDLCDSVTSLAKHGVIPNLEAIRTLCDVQIERRGQPWLLFLTTRAIRGSLDSNTKQRLFERLLQNIKESSDFSTSLNGSLGLDDEAIRAEVAADGTLDGDRWWHTYVVAIAKWLLHYMMGHSYTISVRMLQSYVYSVHGQTRDMVSLAFVFEPAVPPREDNTGLTRSRPAQTPGKSEADLARAIVEKVAAIVDVDEKLASDKNLRLKMFNKSATILASLRYDMQAYKKFAAPD